MARRYYTRFIQLLGVVTLIAGPAFAGDLRVLDNLGLARAVKSINHPANVLVTTKPASNGNAPRLHLSNVDGLAPDIAGAVNGNLVQFPAVAEGTWKIVPEVPTATITEVKIVQ